MEYYEELTYALKHLSVVQSFYYAGRLEAYKEKTAAAALTAMKIFSTPTGGNCSKQRRISLMSAGTKAKPVSVCTSRTRSFAAVFRRYRNTQIIWVSA